MIQKNSEENKLEDQKKIKKKTNKNGAAGRPSKIDEKMLAKMEEGFMMSLTDEECCLYVGINPSNFYRYIQKNPEFGKRKELLKRTPNIKAKQNWLKEITQGNYASSKEWLERKAKDEFSLKQEIDQTNKNIDYTKEEWEKLSVDELEKLANGE